VCDRSSWSAGPTVLRRSCWRCVPGLRCRCISWSWSVPFCWLDLHGVDRGEEPGCCRLAFARCLFTLCHPKWFVCLTLRFCLQILFVGTLNDPPQTLELVNRLLPIRHQRDVMLLRGGTSG